MRVALFSFCFGAAAVVAFSPSKISSLHDRQGVALKMGTLNVNLVKLTHLADTDGIGKTDPYVVFRLEQDNWTIDKKFGKQTSTTKSNDRNPVFNENFEFEIPDLDNMVLECKVMDDDIGFDDKAGEVKIKLERLGLSEKPYAIKKKLGGEGIAEGGFFSGKARIHLELSYVD